MTIAFLLAATARFVVTTADLLQITLLSLLVSGTSTVLATLIAVPLGAGPSAGEKGLFVYLSFEHPFGKGRSK